MGEAEIIKQEEIDTMIEGLKDARDYSRSKRDIVDSILIGTLLGIFIGLFTQISVQIVEIQFAGFNWRPFLFLSSVVVILIAISFLNIKFSRYDKKVEDFSLALEAMKDYKKKTEKGKVKK